MEFYIIVPIVAFLRIKKYRSIVLSFKEKGPINPDDRSHFFVQLTLLQRISLMQTTEFGIG